jgi:hypothetical protein
MKAVACHSVAANVSYEPVEEDGRTGSSYDQGGSQNTNTVVAAAYSARAYNA